MKIPPGKKLLIIFLIALALRVVWIATRNNNIDEWKEEGVKEAAWSLIEGRGYAMPRSVSIYPGNQAKGPAAIDAELARIESLAAMERHGYIPWPDHAIPPDAPWKNWVYFNQQLYAMIMRHVR